MVIKPRQRSRNVTNPAQKQIPLPKVRRCGIPPWINILRLFADQKQELQYTPAFLCFWELHVSILANEGNASLGASRVLTSFLALSLPRLPPLFKILHELHPLLMEVSTMPPHLVEWIYSVTNKARPAKLLYCRTGVILNRSAEIQSTVKGPTLISFQLLLWAPIH